MASAPAISDPSLGSPKGSFNFGTVIRRLYAAAFPAQNAVVAAPKNPCSDIPLEETPEKALLRASGTWGGFQASRPFVHLPRD